MNAISANDAALRSYIQKQQDLACRLAGVTLAIENLEMADIESDATSVLMRIAREMAQALYIGLDSVNLPKPATGC